MYVFYYCYFSYFHLIYYVVIHAHDTLYTPAPTITHFYRQKGAGGISVPGRMVSDFDIRFFLLE